MKKALIAIGLALLVLFAFPSSAQAQECESSTLGQICVSLSGNDVVVTLLGQELVRIPAPIKEVRIQVPGPTVTIQGPTIRVPVPGPTRTVEVPGVGVSGPTVTVTVRPGGQNRAPGVTVEPSSSSTKTGGSRTVSPTVTENVTATPAAKVRVEEKEVRVSVPQAIGFSIGVFLLGVILGLLAIFAAYTVGYKNSEQSELKTWEAFRNEILGGTRKH